MKLRVMWPALALFLAATFALAPFSTAAAQTVNPFQDIPVTGTIDTGGTFTGTLDITRFAVRQGQLVAIGTLTGTLTDALGNVIGTVTNVPVQLPVTGLSGTCEILDLELGPLDLDLLGLVVHLDRINLEITAESGPGNLLGNLLCAIAGLLDNTPNTSGLARLLNQLLRLFG
ncbi:MAG TPA: hypothetical protein VNL77_06015 [Roseiflexaceae bacterium]|nr:hypothetical protein [Roseiflexaceae bacterium]